MSKIQRYSIKMVPSGPGQLSLVEQLDDKGEHVSFEDHEADKAAAVEAALKEAREKLPRFEAVKTYSCGYYHLCFNGIPLDAHSLLHDRRRRADELNALLGHEPGPDLAVKFAWAKPLFEAMLNGGHINKCEKWHLYTLKLRDMVLNSDSLRVFQEIDISVDPDRMRELIGDEVVSLSSLTKKYELTGKGEAVAEAVCKETDD